MDGNDFKISVFVTVAVTAVAITLILSILKGCETTDNATKETAIACVSAGGTWLPAYNGHYCVAKDAKVEVK